MIELLGAGPHQRHGYRAAHYERGLVPRIAKLELRVPRDRHGQFQAALADMYVQGVSTRKVKAITEKRCGHSFSASGIGTIKKGLDEALTAFAERRLTKPCPYLILDGRYEQVREAGVIRSQAVLIAIGIHYGGRRLLRPTRAKSVPKSSSSHKRPLERRNKAPLGRGTAQLDVPPGPNLDSKPYGHRNNRLD